MTEPSPRESARQTPAAIGRSEAPPRLRMLAAEDNRTNQVLLAAMLEPLGVDLHIAADGLEALERFRAGDFELVLMDVQMPVMGGVEATRAIRALERAEGRRPIPILGISGNALSHQVEEYLAAGMTGFVAKPVSMATLIQAVQSALVGAAPAARAAA
jgi:CheY-like chemotaxis protein